MMIDIKQQFSQLFEPQALAIAKIVAPKGNKWQATTAGGQTVFLTGSAEVGKSFYYNILTHKIIEPAPSVAVVDIPLE